MSVVVDKPSWNSRKLYASVQIAAPVETVWGILTDYPALGTFIPGLVKNECLERKPDGCTLLQVSMPARAMRALSTCCIYANTRAAVVLSVVALPHHHFA